MSLSRPFLACFTLLMALNVFAQTTACLAESRGVELAEGWHGCCDAKNTPEDHAPRPTSCGHGDCLQNHLMALAFQDFLFSSESAAVSYRPTDEFLPDSLVREIDQPPQLS